MERLDHYNGNVNIKRSGIVTGWSTETILEYKKCAEDPDYFISTYCKIIHIDHGLMDFKPFKYQTKMWSHFRENRFSIVLACRQSGKSVGVCGYLLWYAIFHSEKVIAVLANKAAVAKLMLARIKLMLEHVPFFIQPGCKTVNKSTIEFDNNSTIIAAATSSTSIRGEAVALLYLDEFAFVENASTFYTSTYPVITGGKESQVIITSTANGMGNMFHKLWEGAMQGTNQYAPLRVDWWDVPGRDDAWKEETIANTSQLQFDQEFGNTFFGTGNTLINGQTLLNMRAKEHLETLEGGLLKIFSIPVKGHEYIMLVDVSTGIGQDYSTFNMIDISVSPFQQVAVYRSNEISPILFPNIIYKYANIYNEAYVIIESNNQGSLVTHGLWHELEYENMHISSAVKADKLGVEMTRRVKRLGCSGIKDILENNKLILNDDETIIECSTFEEKGQTFQASEGNHDDLMMNLVMFGYFVSTENFKDLTDINIKKMLFERREKEIEQDLPPFGFIDDGSETIKRIEEAERYDYPSNQWGIYQDFDDLDRF